MESNKLLPMNICNVEGNALPVFEFEFVWTRKGDWSKKGRKRQKREGAFVLSQVLNTYSS